MRVSSVAAAACCISKQGESSRDTLRMRDDVKYTRCVTHRKWEREIEEGERECIEIIAILI